MIEKIKYAIFDMDGTLIDSLGYWGYLWGELGKKYLGVSGFMADTETDRTVRTITLTEASAVLRDKYFPMASAEDIYDFAIEILKYHYGNRVYSIRVDKNITSPIVEKYADGTFYVQIPAGTTYYITRDNRLVRGE